MSVNVKTASGVNEINKMYLKTSNGVSQIGKVYEFDGTAFKPIYSSGSWLLKEGVGGEVFRHIVTMVECTSSCDFIVHQYSKVPYKTFNIYCSASAWQWAENYYSDKKLVDLSGVDKITLKWSWENGTGARDIHLGIGDILVPPLGTNNDCVAFRNALLKRVTYGSHSDNRRGELVLDVSDISGEHYIVFGTTCAYNTWANVYFTEIHLS